MSNPRVYMLNLFNELLSSIINPGATITPEVPSLGDVIEGKANGTSVGGSYFICIDPSKFGPMADVLAKSDRFAQAIEDSPARPGQRPPRMPGSGGYKSLTTNAEEVDVLDSHWGPFFKTQAGQYGLSEEGLRADWEAQRNK